MTVIFHVDVNSAFLAWNAIWDLAHGSPVDLRSVPAVVGGDPKSRRGIVLARSIPAKAFGIVTGETLYSALAKCPELIIASPRYSVYTTSSDAMMQILIQYSPLRERYSIDECFLEMGSLDRAQALQTAHRIRRQIGQELGFTVNVGIGPNKLCAKMASDFRKPDQVHTLYEEEILTKLHPLPVEDLFMVGPALAKKLRGINITTIGQLARCDRGFLAGRFGRVGDVIWNFAWGRDSSAVNPDGAESVKGIGNSTTLPSDLITREECHRTLASLLETLVPRLKAAGVHATCIAIHVTWADFTLRRHQCQLPRQTDSEQVLYATCRDLFHEIWDGRPVRKLGIACTGLRSSQIVQLSMLDPVTDGRRDRLDTTLLGLRQRFGDDSLTRGSLIRPARSADPTPAK